jgi:hypothetical protein
MRRPRRSELELVAVAAFSLTGSLLLGCRLVPDSELYAHAAGPAFVGNLLGLIGGMTALSIGAAIAAAACVGLVPHGRRRLLFAIAAGWWFLFPGVDALGLLVVALAARRRSPALMIAGLLVHPVAALVGWPLLLPARARARVAGVGLLTLAAIVSVGLLDTWATTDRYALVLAWALAAVGCRRAEPGACAGRRTASPSGAAVSVPTVIRRRTLVDELPNASVNAERAELCNSTRSRILDAFRARRVLRSG